MPLLLAPPDGDARAARRVVDRTLRAVFAQYLRSQGTVTGWPSMAARPAGARAALFPTYRRLIPCQIDDLEAMERLGVRLDAYARLKLPVATVGGERSPDRLKDMVTAVADVLPRATRVTLRGQAHSCNVRDPNQLAAVIETFANSVVR